MVLWVGSLSKGKLSLCFSLNETRALTGSALMPRMATPRWSNCFFASRNSDASMVQPGVLALGNKKRRTRWPAKSFSAISRPSSESRRKAGALAPIFSIWLASSYLEHFILSRLDVRNLPYNPYLRKRHWLSASNHFRDFANNLCGFDLLTQRIVKIDDQPNWIKRVRLSEFLLNCS